MSNIDKIGEILFNISLEHYVVLSFVLLAIGILGIILKQQNIIGILMSIEIMLVATNILFVAVSSHYNDVAGEIVAIFILTVAAAEVAIGLSILVCYFDARGKLSVSDLNKMHG